MRGYLVEPMPPTVSKAPFQICTIEGVEQPERKMLIDKHLQSNFEIIWILEGSGFHRINEYRYQVSANKMYCVCPGQEHQLILAPGAKGFALGFTEDFLSQAGDDSVSRQHYYLFREFLQAPELTVESDVAEDMQDVILLMLKETQKYSLLRKEILSKYLVIFMIYFRKELQKHLAYTVKNTSNSLVNDFFSILENNFKDHRTVGYYAKALFVTPNYLNHLIKSSTGQSARYHIQQRVLLAAKTALRERSTMKEIAFHLGFEDIAHFSKFFKNVSGLNFSEFKKQMNHLNVSY